MRDRVIHLVTRLETLPTLPVVAGLLNEKLADPDVDAGGIARVIEDDPAIMARVMKLVNSPIYAPTLQSPGRKGKINLREAVVRLGFNVLRDLVLTTSIVQAMAYDEDVSFDRAAFWRHSVNCGLIARTLSQFSSVEHRIEESTFILAGLCHDLGKLILDQNFPEQFGDILRVAKDHGRLMFEVELELLGIEHGEVGGLLAQRWGLPREVREAMNYHHRLKDLPRDMDNNARLLTHTVALADYITNHQNLGFSGNYRAMDFPVSSFEALGLSTSDIRDIVSRVREDAGKSELLVALETE